jgi:hypothetical protein
MTSVHRRLIHAAAGALLFCSAGTAAAQYLWVDAKGIKQFSDQPPPPSIPLKNILKAPKGQPSAATAAAEAPAAGDAPAAPAATAPPTLAQRELNFQKRKKEKDEQEKKDRDDSARQLARQEECGRSRQAKAGLDSGARIRTTDPNGERGYMDDAQRAAELARIDRQLAGCPAR